MQTTYNYVSLYMLHHKDSAYVHKSGSIKQNMALGGGMGYYNYALRGNS